MSSARKPHPLGLLHRYGGVTAAVFVVFICSTGILLNHTDGLRLAELQIDNPLVLQLYGIEEPTLEAVAITADGIRVDGAGQTWLFTADGELLETLDTTLLGPIADAARSDPDILATNFRAQIAQQYRGSGVSLERVILDLHSGRLAGRGGVWLADAAAVLFILLALSGLWLWYKTRGR